MQARRLLRLLLGPATLLFFLLVGGAAHLVAFASCQYGAQETGFPFTWKRSTWMPTERGDREPDDTYYYDRLAVDLAIYYAAAVLLAARRARRRPAPNATA